MTKESKFFGRWLFSVAAAVIAAALILFGVGMFALNSSLSDKNMVALANSITLEEYMDKSALVKAFNTAIYKWSNAFSASSIYVTEERLGEVIDEESAKESLGKVFRQIAHALKGGTAEVTPQMLLPATGKVAEYTAAKLGTEITEEMRLAELETAVDYENLNGPYPKLVKLWLGIVLIVLAVILLAVMLFVRRENLFMGGFYLTCAFGVPAFINLTMGKLVKAEWFTVSHFPVKEWLPILAKSMKTMGIFCLIPAVLGVGLMIAYLIDRRRVKNYTLMHRSGDGDEEL